MKGRRTKWQVRLGSDAGRDLVRIVRRTRETFGLRQAEVYAETLRAALTALEDGPDIAGSKARDDVQPGFRTLHVARGRRRGRHFVMYRVGAGMIDVLRILHDAMDLARHVPKEVGGDDAE